MIVQGVLTLKTLPLSLSFITFEMWKDSNKGVIKRVPKIGDKCDLNNWKPIYNCVKCRLQNYSKGFSMQVKINALYIRIKGIVLCCPWKVNQ